MCLITEQKRAKTLKEDLRVKKIMAYVGVHATSLFHHFIYDLDKIYKTKISKSVIPKDYFGWEVLEAYPDWETNPNYRHIYEGFHSMILDRKTPKMAWRYTYADCIIPKGSKVFYDKTGLIASDQIIVLGEYYPEPVEMKRYV